MADCRWADDLGHEKGTDEGKFHEEEPHDVPIHSRLLSSVVHENLGQLDRGQCKCMDTKHYIIWVNLSGIANLLIDVSLQVIHGIKVKANRVEHSKLHREACHTLRLVILPALRVEAQGPQHEADPPAGLLQGFVGVIGNHYYNKK